LRPGEADWARLLTDASAKVQSIIKAAAHDGGLTGVLGVGASGDKTLLADKRAEDELLRALEKIEGLRVLSEEAGEAGDRGANTVAVLDPVDGSANFERGVPFYCTSAAIVEGSTLRGVNYAMIRDLVTGDLYLAQKGKGATKNGKALSTSKSGRLSESVVGIDMSRGDRVLVSKLGPLVGAAKRQVHYGANALELCLVADGRIEAFVDLRGKMRITDFAAAYLIASEAGAKVTDQDGGELDPAISLGERFSFVAAANDGLHREIMKLLSDDR
jgi:myo-inositol-1(or 4)-monophosphatase